MHAEYKPSFSYLLLFSAYILYGLPLLTVAGTHIKAEKEKCIDKLARRTDEEKKKVFYLIENIFQFINKVIKEREKWITHCFYYSLFFFLVCVFVKKKESIVLCMSPEITNYCHKG